MLPYLRTIDIQRHFNPTGQCKRYNQRIKQQGQLLDVELYGFFALLLLLELLWRLGMLLE